MIKRYKRIASFPDPSGEYTFQDDGLGTIKGKKRQGRAIIYTGFKPRRLGAGDFYP
jgi:hypothetical protein